MTRWFYLLAPIFFLGLVSSGLADSTRVAPLSSPTVKYPSTTSLAPPAGITNHNYISVVPRLCSAVNAAHCPTINKQSPSALGLSQAVMDQDCPDYCRAERTLSGTGWTLQSRDAVCPPGYASVAQYRSETDLYLATSGVVTKLPRTLDIYDCYQKYGFECEDTGGSGLYQQNPDTCEKGKWLYSIGQYTDDMPGTTSVVKVTDRFQVCIGSACFFCGYSYVTIKCLGLGLIGTCNTFLPTVQICARISPEWKQH